MHISLFYTQPNNCVVLDPGKLIEVKGNPLVSTEFPMLMIMDSVQKLDSPQLDNNFVVFAYNCGDSEIIIPKHTTVADLVTTTLHLKIKIPPRHKQIFGSKIYTNLPRKNHFYQLRKANQLFMGTLHCVNTLKDDTKVKIELSESEI